MTPPFDEPTGDDDAQDIPDWLADGDLDSDDAIAWLEELAAKYDPNFESSVSTPEDDEEAEALPDTMLVPDSVEPGDEEVPDWLREEPEREPEPTASVAPAQPREEAVPDWLLDEDEEPEEEVEPAPVTAASTAEDEEDEQEDLFDWLRQPLSVEEDEGLPDWLLDEEEPEERAPAAMADEAEEGVPAWLREEPARDPLPDAAVPPVSREPERSFDWLRDEDEEPEEEVAPARAASAPAAEPLPAEAVEAFDWLDEQVSSQGVRADDALAEALTPDFPPVEHPAPPDLDAVAEPVSADSLPDWLRGVEVRAEADEEDLTADVLDEELEQLVRVDAEDDELAWLESTLEAESDSVSADELAELFAEAAKAGVEFGEEAEEPEPAAPLPQPRAPSELPAPEGADALSLPEGERETRKPIRLTGPTVEGEPIALGASAGAEAEVDFSDELLEEDELPAWLKDMEAQLLPAEATAEGEEEELPDWLKEPEPREAPVETEPAAEAPVQKDVPQVPWPEAELAGEAPPAEEVARVEEPAAEVVEPEPAPVAAEDDHERLRLARERLDAKDVGGALPYYETLVARGQMLEQTVADLSYVLQTEARTEPRIRRVRGDALRAQGKLQEALDAYRQALDDL